MSPYNVTGPGAGSPPSVTVTEANHQGTPGPQDDRLIAVPARCPACTKPAFHLPELGFYYHQDGTDNGLCWYIILTGRDTPPVCPTCEREMHP